MKFSSESLQIWCMDSLYHTNQYMGNYMFVYIIIFCIFVFFQYFYFALEYNYIPSWLLFLCCYNLEFSSLGLCLIICRVGHLSDELRYAFLVTSEVISWQCLSVLVAEVIRHIIVLPQWHDIPTSHSIQPHRWPDIMLSNYVELHTGSHNYSFKYLGYYLRNHFPDFCHEATLIRENSRSGKSKGILEFVSKIWNFVESQGNLRKFCKKLWWSNSISKYFRVTPLALASYFSTHFILELPFFTKICYLKHIQACTFIIIQIRTYLNFCMFDWSEENGDKSGESQGILISCVSGNSDLYSASVKSLMESKHTLQIATATCF